MKNIEVGSSTAFSTEISFFDKATILHNEDRLFLKSYKINDWIFFLTSSFSSFLKSMNICMGYKNINTISLILK